MVGTMRSNVAVATILVCCSWTLPTHVIAQTNCLIKTVEVLEPSQARIIPGEPLTIVLKTNAAFSGGSEAPSVARASAMVARALSQLVHIDGQRFGNRLSHGSLNEVARFTPTRTDLEEFSRVGPDTVYEFRCTASFFLSASKGRAQFVFSSPGIHEIVFGDPKEQHAVLTVTVYKPTAAEDSILGELIANPEVLLFLTDPTDCTNCTQAVGRTLESSLEQYPGTRLEKYVRVALGASKFCQLRRLRQESLGLQTGRDAPAAVDSHDIEIAFRNGYIDLAEYFHTPAAGDIWSEFDLLAVWHNARIELARARNASSLAEGEIHIANFVHMANSIAGHRTSSTKWTRRIESRDEMVESARAAIRRSEQALKQP